MDDDPVAVYICPVGQRGGAIMAVFWRILLFGAVVAIWVIAARLPLSPAWSFVCTVGFPLAVYPVVRAARHRLDAEATPANARAVTVVAHAAILALYGPAIILALPMFTDWRGWTIPIPRALANAIFAATSVAMTLAVANLALRAFGAPFAIALSRKLAVDWLYQRTRNPMVLTTILWFVSIGLALQSASFVFWVLFVLTPAELEFLLVFEERELEIRFGQAYLDYRARTPFLLPRLLPRRRREYRSS